MFYQGIILETKADLTQDQIIEFLAEKKVIKGSYDKNLTIEIRREKGRQNISINQARELIEWNGFQSNELRMGIIYEAHSLSREAQNSLLKVLEEPSENTLFILITKSTDKLLDTILSRCLSFFLSFSSERILPIDFFTKDFVQQKKILNEIYAEHKDYFLIEEVINEFVEHFNNNMETSPETKEATAKFMIELFDNCFAAYKNGANPKFIFDSLILSLKTI